MQLFFGCVLVIIVFRVVEDGAGVRWTPLHFNAEAPTEPAGETVPLQVVAVRQSYYISGRAMLVPTVCY